MRITGKEIKTVANQTEDMLGLMSRTELENLKLHWASVARCVLELVEEINLELESRKYEH